MKRTFPNSRIEEFFIKQSKPTPTVLSSTRQNQNLTFIKTTPQKKVKIITIPGLSDEPAPSEEFYQSIWSYLQKGIDGIFYSDPLSVNFNKIYHDVEYFCRLKKPIHLYNLIGPYLQNIVNHFVEDLSTSEEINSISTKISHFESSISALQTAFMYFDRSFLFTTRNDGFSSLSSLIHSQLRTSLLEREEILSNMANQLCIQISLFRIDDDIDFTPLNVLLHFFNDIGLYDQEVKQQILEQTNEFYAKTSVMNLTEYLEFLTQAIKIECGLVEQGLPQESHDLILQIIREQCLLGHQDILFGPEFDQAFDEKEKENNFQTLLTLRQFFNTDDTFPVFSEKYSEHYSKEISEIFNQSQSEWIELLLKSYSAGLKLVKSTFKNDTSISRILKSTYEQSFQKVGHILPKLLARRMSKDTGIDPAEINLFRLIPMKELFEESYKYSLGKKITSRINFDIDRERHLLKKLSAITGKEFTLHLEEMLNDVTESSKIPIPPVVGLEFTGLVVSSHNYHSVNILSNSVLYPEKRIEKAQNLFGKSYQEKYPRRILTWSPLLSSAVLSFGTISIQTTGIHALILINIQKQPNFSISLNKLIEITNLDENTSNSFLSDLISPRCGEILKKTIINDQEIYEINYQHKLKGGEVFSGPIQKLTFSSERSENNSDVIISNMLKCHITHIMKKFRLLSVNDLFAKVSKSVPFNVDQGKFIEILGNLKNLEIISSLDDKTYQYLE